MILPTQGTRMPPIFRGPTARWVPPLVLAKSGVSEQFRNRCVRFARLVRAFRPA
jgi:hypothetical protein